MFLKDFLQTCSQQKTFTSSTSYTLRVNITLPSVTNVRAMNINSPTTNDGTNFALSAGELKYNCVVVSLPSFCFITRKESVRLETFRGATSKKVVNLGGANTKWPTPSPPPPPVMVKLPLFCGE